MNTQQLHCFLCVADRLNFTKAAEELYLTPPTVTHTIKMLETELKAALFIRTSKKVQLTAAGREFYYDAKEILAKMELAEKKILKIAHENTGHLHIGCTSNAELKYLKKVLLELAEHYPSVYPKFFVEDYFTLKKLFEDRQIDCMLCTQKMIKKMRNCEFRKLKTIHNYLIFNDTAALPPKKEYFFSDIECQKLILLHPKLIPFEYDDEIRRRFSAHALEHFDIFCENDRTAIFLAECGYGIAIMPEFCIPENLRDVQVHPFENLRFTFEYGLAVAKDLKKPGLRFLAENLHC